MTFNQIKTHLAQVFEQDYQGYDSFVKDVIDIIFTGEDAYEALSAPENIIDDTNRNAATRAGIKSVFKIGRIDAIEGIDVYDITLFDDKQLQYNRVGIQQLIRSQQMFYSTAFLLFHNEQPEGKEWRFSFFYKQGKIKDTTPAKRFTYLFGKNFRSRTASERFAQLADEEKSTQNLLNAFSVEALSKNFFNEYKGQYDIFCKFLFDHKNDTEYFGSEFTQWEDKFLRDYVKKMMGRITFIYFLQRKGWMNGNMEYMQKAFEQSPYQDNYLDAFLEPLFFGVLNTKPEERKTLFEKEGWALSLLDEWKDVPYLNGGLFERDEQDEPKSKFPAELFKGLFDFYSRYNFTIDENDPDDAEVGVDPEMLGHIFENLLEDNKDKGAFYTPKEIVQYMSQESIAQYLKTHTEEALHPAIDELIKEKKVNDLLQNKAVASAVYALLQEVKVCDPAIGSGAFPMGVLNVLYHARLLLYGFTKPTQEFSPSEVKREIIQNNIYGVDIEKGAIDIARLRFWLSIVVDSEQPEALPNFDYKFMQGNSLLEEFGGIDLSSLQNQVMQPADYEPQRDLFGNVEDSQMKMTFTQKETVDNLQANLEKYFNIDDHTKKQAVKEEISNSVKDHILYNINLRKERCLRIISDADVAISDEESQIEDIKARFPEDKMPVSEIRKHEKKISDLKRVIDKNNKIVHHYDLVSHELETIDLTSNESFFLWHTWFKDVFDNGGFDVVIGNPPYIDSETMTKVMPEMRELYARLYGCAKGNWDIFVVFIELGVKLLNQNGTYSFIIPNKLVAAKYTEKLREYLSANTLVEIRDYGTVPVFTSAAVYPATIVGQKGEQNKKPIIFSVMKDINEKSIDNAIEGDVFHNMFFWDVCFQPHKEFFVFRKILNNSMLSEIEGISINGAATVSEAYLLKEFIMNSIDYTNAFKVVNTGTIDRYTNLWGETPMQYLKGRYQYPIAKEDDVKQMSEIRFQQAKSEKIIVAGMSKTIEAIYDNGCTLAGKSTTIITGKEKLLKFILGIVNSRVASYFTNIAYNSLKMAGGFINIGVRELEHIPIPKASSMHQSQIIAVVNIILAAKKDDPQADTREMEQQIDLLVYHLYGLTYEEVLIVDPETQITKEEYESK